MPVVRDYTALISGASLHGTSGQGAFYTYSFSQIVPSYQYDSYSDEELATFQPLTADQKVMARQALDAWASICGITFFEVPAGQGDMQFGRYDMAVIRPGAGAFAFYPGGQFDSPINSDVFMGLDFGMSTLLHEIGHAIGLKHTFDGDVILAEDLDNYGSSVMSYTSGGFPGDVLGNLDRDAVQFLYGNAGADGDQVASWSWQPSSHTLTQTGFDLSETILGVATTDFIFGKGGDDIVQGRGGNDKLDGGEGDDDLRGSGGADTLIGGSGDDDLDGGEGNDRLTGGIGADTLYGWEGDEQIEGGADNDSVHGQKGNDKLFGDGGLDKIWGGEGDDYIEGGDDADYLLGEEGADTLLGGGGDDYLSDGDGADVVKGGAGDDFATLVYAGAPFHADGGLDGDHLEIRLSSDLAAPQFSLGALPAGVTIAGFERFTIRASENGATIVGSAVVDNLYGGSGNDRLAGGGGGDNLGGGDGADVIDGGEGADGLSGGLGADRFVYAFTTDSAAAASEDYIAGFETGTDKIDLSAFAAATVTLFPGTFSNTGKPYTYVYVATDGGEMRIFVEGVLVMGDLIMPGEAPPIVGGTGDDTLDGTSLADEINGLGGADTLNGLGDDDLLDGGAGADTMRGGGGDDTYIVDNRGDRVIETSATGGTDTVRSLVGFTLPAFVEHLDLSGGSALGGFGNGGANTLIGNAAANTLEGRDAADWLLGFGGKDVLLGGAGDDELDGGGGADTMRGGGGDDDYVVGQTGDRVEEASASGGFDTVTSSLGFTLGAHIEKLVLAGSGAVTGIGNGLANTIEGNGAANSLNGKAGADLMKGFAGNDLYYVDHSGDRAVESSSGGGVDTVSSKVDFTLGAHVEKLVLAGTAAIDGIGNGLANAITGNGAANVLRGGDGDDTLKGGDGADQLRGGKNADRLTGGAGGDRFVFDTTPSAGNVDDILDFARGSDKIVLENAIFKGVGASVFAASALVVGTAAAVAGDRIIYNPATGALLYDSDGNGSAAAVHFATLDTKPATLSASDFAVI